MRLINSTSEKQAFELRRRGYRGRSHFWAVLGHFLRVVRSRFLYSSFVEGWSYRGQRLCRNQSARTERKCDKSRPPDVVAFDLIARDIAEAMQRSSSALVRDRLAPS